MLQVQDLGDPGDVDALRQVADRCQEIQIVVAVAAVPPSVRAGVSSPRRSYRRSVCGSIPVNSAATEMPYTPRADRARKSSGTELLPFATNQVQNHPCTNLAQCYNL